MKNRISIKRLTPEMAEIIKENMDLADEVLAGMLGIESKSIKTAKTRYKKERESNRAKKGVFNVHEHENWIM